MGEHKQVPSVGRVVHVVTFDNQHRPALVVDPCNGITITVTAFTTPFDHINEQGQQVGAVLWFIEHCAYDESARPGTWHWPEYVPNR